ncbi:hypothetical protein ON010_g17508 [Phytophthora cinnamomi]|nr:hypothetical protein ON010_g17508 [Phytophthora cinnamomi]
MDEDGGESVHGDEHDLGDRRDGSGCELTGNGDDGGVDAHARDEHGEQRDEQTRHRDGRRNQRAERREASTLGTAKRSHSRKARTSQGVDG